MGEPEYCRWRARIREKKERKKKSFVAFAAAVFLNAAQMSFDKDKAVNNDRGSLFCFVTPRRRPFDWRRAVSAAQDLPQKISREMKVKAINNAVIFACIRHNFSVRLLGRRQSSNKGPFLHPETSKSFSKKEQKDAPLTSIPPFSGLPPDYGFGRDHMQRKRKKKDFDAMPEIAR